MKRVTNYLLKSHEGQLLVVWGLCFGLGSGLGYAGGVVFRGQEYIPFEFYGVLIGFSLGGLVAGWFLYRTLQQWLALTSPVGWKSFVLFWIAALLLADVSIWLFFQYVISLAPN